MNNLKIMDSLSINFRKVPFSRITLFLILGILSREWINPMTLEVGYFLLSFLFAGLWIIHFLSKRYLFTTRLYFSVSSLVIFLVGLLSAHQYNDIRHIDAIRQHIENGQAFYGEVLEKSVKGEKVKYTVGIDSLKSDSVLIQGCAFKIIIQRADTLLTIGDVIQISGRLMPLMKPSNSLDFNYQRFLARKQIHFQMFKANVSVMQSAQPTLLQKWQATYVNGIDESPLNTLSKSILKAMLAGDKSALGDITEIFRKTGTSHVLAISGLHVGIISMLIHFLLGFFKSRLKWIRPIAVIAGVWIFCLLSGCYPSTVRACSMVSLYCIGLLLKRKSFGLNLCCIAAFFMLCKNPNLIYDIGFQFSFLAVLGILFFFQPIYRVFVLRGIMDKLWQMTVLSLSAQVFILPLSIYYFHTFPVYFIVTSWVAVPMTFLNVIIGLCFVLLSLIGLEFEFLVGVINTLMKLLVEFLSFFSKVSHATINDLWPSGMELVAYYVFFFAMLLFIRFRTRFTFVLPIISFLLVLMAYQVNNHQKQADKFIVYKNSYHRVIDFVSNGRIVRFYDDNISEKKLQYLTKNTQSYHQVDSVSRIPLSPFENHQIRIKDKLILIYNGKEEYITSNPSIIMTNKFDYPLKTNDSQVLSFKRSRLEESFPNYEITFNLNK